MLQIMLIVLGAILVVGAVKGLSDQGIWLTSNRRLEGTPAKVIGIGAIIGGVIVIAYAVFILPRR